MKKTLTIIVLLSFIFSIYSQVPPNKENEGSATFKNKKMYYEEERADNPYYLEIKLSKNQKGIKIIMPDVDLKGIKVKRILKKFEQLMELKPKTTKGNFNLLTETNKISLKLISHNFNILKDTEIHYYIFEL